ncbi:unnamed protein product [Amoebophrya sp. A25]|nr:unnamed protein product [Amoebophrya sp. A25]|eukprot:GSA25T00026717001.1
MNRFGALVSSSEEEVEEKVEVQVTANQTPNKSNRKKKKTRNASEKTDVDASKSDATPVTPVTNGKGGGVVSSAKTIDITDHGATLGSMTTTAKNNASSATGNTTGGNASSATGNTTATSADQPQDSTKKFIPAARKKRRGKRISTPSPVRCGSPEPVLLPVEEVKTSNKSTTTGANVASSSSSANAYTYAGPSTSVTKPSASPHAAGSTNTTSTLMSRNAWKQQPEANPASMNKLPSSDAATLVLPEEQNYTTSSSSTSKRVVEVGEPSPAIVPRTIASSSRTSDEGNPVVSTQVKMSSPPVVDVVPNLRLLQWNILAPTLAEGSEAGEVERRTRQLGPELYLRTPSDWSGGVHYFLDEGEGRTHQHVFRAANEDLAWSRRKVRIFHSLRDYFFPESLYPASGPPVSAGHQVNNNIDHCEDYNSGRHNGAAASRSVSSPAALDFACLQEIEEPFYKNLIETFRSVAVVRQCLESVEVDGIFFKKRGHFAKDGCCILYNRRRWQLLKSKRTKLMDNAIMVAAMGRFRRIVQNQQEDVIIATTHLKAGFSEAMESLRVEQVKGLAWHISEFDAETSRIYGANKCKAVVLAADLNSHCRPYVNTITVEGDQVKTLQDPVLPSVVPFLERLGFRNAVESRSGTAALNPASTEDTYPAYTTWAGWMDRDVKAVLDYVLVWRPPSLSPATSTGITDISSSCFPHLPPPKNDINTNQEHRNVASTLEVPSFAIEFADFASQKVLDAYVVAKPEKLPNRDHPSDHVAIIANICI